MADFSHSVVLYISGCHHKSMQSLFTLTTLVLSSWHSVYVASPGDDPGVPLQTCSPFLFCMRMHTHSRRAPLWLTTPSLGRPAVA